MPNDPKMGMRSQDGQLLSMGYMHPPFGQPGIPNFMGAMPPADFMNPAGPHAPMYSNPAGFYPNPSMGPPPQQQPRIPNPEHVLHGIPPMPPMSRQP